MSDTSTTLKAWPVAEQGENAPSWRASAMAAWRAVQRTLDVALEAKQAKEREEERVQILQKVARIREALAQVGITVPPDHENEVFVIDGYEFSFDGFLANTSHTALTVERRLPKALAEELDWGDAVSHSFQIPRYGQTIRVGSSDVSALEAFGFALTKVDQGYDKAIADAEAIKARRDARAQEQQYTPDPSAELLDFLYRHNAPTRVLNSARNLITKEGELEQLQEKRDEIAQIARALESLTKLTFESITSE